MKKIYLTALFCMSLLHSGKPLFALESSRITYQGQLREDGVAVTAVKSMKFRIYNSSTSATALWTSSDYSVQVTSGLFRAVLEPAGVNWESAALYLEVAVDNVTLSPREEITMAPFAVNSGLHSGKKYTSAASAPASPGGGDLWWDTSGKALFVYDGTAWQAASSVVGTNPWTRSAPNAFLQNSSDLVGIGTSVPVAKLHVSGGSLQVGDGASASIISQSGYVSLANLASAPSASRGRVFFDSTGAGALKISLDGSSFVSIATGIAGAGGGMSAISANAFQFSGDGSGGSPLTLRPSSVTLLGNGVNSSNGLVRLDSGGKLPTLDAGALLGISSVAVNAINSDSQIASGANIAQSKIANLTSDLGNRLLKAGDTMSGDLQIGQASASTFSASGYFTAANLPVPPSAARGRIYFDPAGGGALKISLDGAGFVPLSTGSAGGGISSVVSNAAQFSGDGNSGNALTLRPSSVTLAGNVFNAANSLLKLDFSALVPVANLGGLTDSQILAGANIAKSKISGTGAWALSDIPNLPAGQITSGTFGDSRVSVSTAAVTGNWELSRLSSGIMPANVVASSVAVSSVGSLQVADGSIYGQDIALSTITLNRLNQSGCSINDIPKWNGSVWGCGIDIGVSSESDPKVGSLTSSRVPRWNGTALADGMIYDNAASVGIGTTLPAARLEVAGGNIRALSQASANNPSSGKGVEVFYDGSGNDRGRILSIDRDVPVNKPLLLDGSSLLLNAISGGNVGVGNLSPGARLDVEGSAQFGSTAKSTFTSAGVLQLASALGSAYGGTGADLSASGTGALPYFSASGVMGGLAAGTAGQLLQSNGAAAPSWISQSALTVSTASNIAGGAAGTLPYQSGPGATAMLSTGLANQILQSNGAAAPSWTGAPAVSGANITSIPESGVTGLVSDLGNRVLKTGDSMSGQLTLNGSTLTVTGSGFSVGGSTLTAVNGNVGIGTTSPAGKFEVFDSVSRLLVNSNTVKIDNQLWFNNPATIGIIQSERNAANAGVAFQLLTKNASDAQTSRLELTGGVDTANLGIINSNVGIGTTSPGAKLDIQAASAADSYSLRAGTSTTAYHLVVSTTGNVGIGTNAPQDALDIGSGFLRVKRYGGISLISNDTPGNIQGLRIRPDAGYASNVVALEGWNYTSGAGTPMNLVFTGGGSVGIGTTGPTNTLHVKKTAGTNGVMTLEAPNTNGFAGVSFITDYSTNWNGMAGVGGSNTGFASYTRKAFIVGYANGAAGTGTTGMNFILEGNSEGEQDWRFVSGNAGDTKVIIKQNSGNVGIGTTNPVAALDVVGAEVVRGYNLDYGGADIPWVHNLGGLVIGENRSRGSVETDFISSPGSAGQGGGFGFYVAPAGGNTINPLMYLEGGGNVGVGTTSPGQKLSVAGTIESTSGGVKFPDGTVQPTAMGGAYASVYRTGVQSFAAVGTWYNVPMNNELSKVNITHSNATNPERVQVSATGLYQITYTVNFKNTAASACSGSARLVKNDTTEIAGTYQTTAVHATNYTAVIGATIVANLSVNDYVTVQAGANDITSIQIDVYTAGVTPTTASVATLTIVRLN